LVKAIQYLIHWKHAAISIKVQAPLFAYLCLKFLRMKYIIPLFALLTFPTLLFVSCSDSSAKGKGEKGLVLPKKDTSALKKVPINLDGKQSKEKVQLAFTPQKGNKKTIALTMKSIFGKDVLLMTFTSEMQVTDRLSNGDVLTRTKILDIHAKTNEAEIDAKTSKELEPLMNGFSYVTYNRLGKVLSMKADNPQLDAQFKSNQSNGFMPEFPSKALGVGDSWEQTNKQVIQQQEITIKYTYFVRAINPESVALELRANVFNQEKEIFTIQGMIETDRKTGFPMHGNLEQKVKGMGTNYVNLTVR